MKVLLSIIFGGAILYWMYRDFDFSRLGKFMLDEMDWTWMLLSFPFGILAQTFRAWRWRQTLEAADEHSRRSVRENSIFFSYAISLLIPRLGEFARCGVLTRYDKVSFAKAIGTVVTERIIDSTVILFITGATLLLQINVFGSFFDETGTSIDGIINRFTTAGWIVTIICIIAVIAVVVFMMKKMTVHSKIKDALHSVGEGVMSLKKVKNIPLFIVFSIGIWVAYFLHYYLTFFCFDFTANLGIMCALVTFVVGSIAVIVPTPNGAGPWHFAVKTMLVLYGVAETDALYFVLIVHTVQTLLVLVLGIYSMAALAMTKRKAV
ncbi:MAG: lysylphosphatidylglycerol synthase transmembrane domain-containing protein [Prevotellaceae bacterium]|nr:lysylphosphatidylglycerol synthase transmembrane domain-containing protein [Prevotellaceae bacterium]